LPTVDFFGLAASNFRDEVVCCGEFVCAPVFEIGSQTPGNRGATLCFFRRCTLTRNFAVFSNDRAAASVSKLMRVRLPSTLRKSQYHFSPRKYMVDTHGHNSLEIARFSLTQELLTKLRRVAETAG
jgi:hypothetical protein